MLPGRGSPFAIVGTAVREEQDAGSSCVIESADTLRTGLHRCNALSDPFSKALFWGAQSLSYQHLAGQPAILKLRPGPEHVPVLPWAGPPRSV